MKWTMRIRKSTDAAISRLLLKRNAAWRCRIRHRSQQYLATKKAQVLWRLIACLEDLATQEFTTLTSEERVRVAAVLDRLDFSDLMEEVHA